MLRFTHVDLKSASIAPPSRDTVAVNSDFNLKVHSYRNSKSRGADKIIERALPHFSSHTSSSSKGLDNSEGSNIHERAGMSM
jgi:hypothetical protein